MRVAMLCNESPWPVRNGGRTRMAGLIAALGTEHEVDVLVARGPSAEPVDDRALALPVARRSRLSCLVSPEPFLGRRLLDGRSREAVATSTAAADVVLVSHSYLAPDLSGLPARVVVDLQNLETERQASLGGPLGRWEAWKAARWEPEVVRAAEAVVAVSEADAEVVQSWGAQRVLVVPNTAEVPVSPPSPDEGYVLALADWRYGPNARGLEVLVQEVAPVLGARLVIAGRGSERIGGLGFVRDLDSLYDGAALVVSPVVSGAGTQLKVVEAVTRGRVVVTTPYGAASLPSGAPSEAVEAVRVAELAARVRALLTDVEGRHRREDLLRSAPVARSWVSAAAPLLEHLRG